MWSPEPHDSLYCLLGVAGFQRSAQRGLIVQKRFYRAMAAYVVLALMATFTLDGKMRIAVWILLAGLAVKTVIAYKTIDL